MLLNIYNFIQNYLSSTSFQEICDFLQTNFMSILILLGFVGVTIRIASTIIRIIAVLFSILLIIKLFLLH